MINLSKKEVKIAVLSSVVYSVLFWTVSIFLNKIYFVQDNLLLLLILKVFLFISLSFYFCMFLDKISKNIFKHCVKLTLFAAVGIISLDLVFNEQLKSFSVANQYKSTKDLILFSNDGKEPNTLAYNEFKFDMKNNDADKIKFYYHNTDHLLSIGRDTKFNLMLLTDSVGSSDIKSKLEEVTKDNFISIKEYNEFKNFVIDSKINEKYLAFLK